MNQLKIWWELLVSLGTSADNDRWLNKKIRLINSLAVIGVVTLLLWSASYLFDGKRITSLEAFIPAIVLAFIVYLNKYKWYITAKYLHYFFVCLIFIYYGIAHGAKDGAEYFLFLTCIMGLMYFDKMKTLVLLLIFNICSFWLIKYTHTIMPPPVLSGHELYVPNLISVFLVLFLIAFYFKRENQFQESLLLQQNHHLEEEKTRSEKLLLNILPKEVADELKETGTNSSRLYEKATVLFTDFSNFTRISEAMSPSDLVLQLNEYFTAFDNIILKYNLEKIKTIGDAYLCVGGLPTINQTNPFDAIDAALEIREFVNKKKEVSIMNGEPYYELRIGIHTGPVIAGVVGKIKFAYDIWGDTVNTASRIESVCETGRINISQETYEIVKNRYNIISRGKIDVKSKGLIEMYYVEAVI